MARNMLIIENIEDKKIQGYFIKYYNFVIFYEMTLKKIKK